VCLRSGQIAAASFLTNVMECNDGKAEEANRDEAAKENAEENSADETRVAVEGDSGEGTDS
jgi:hypothetical protein